MSEFKNRLREMGTLHRAGKDLTDSLTNRAQRRVVIAKGRALIDTAYATWLEDDRNRPGLLMDTTLRTFAADFNGRLKALGLAGMPTSFNVLGAMIALDEKLPLFRVRPERSHLFSWVDFIDFATSSDIRANPFEEAARLPEGQVFSYNAYDDPHDLTFSVGGEEYGVGGISFIRHGDEVSLALVAGRAANFDEEEQRIRGPVLGGRPGVGPDSHFTPGPVALEGTSDLLRTVVLTRYRTSAQAEQVRYLLTDHGNRWNVITDDPVIFDAQDAEHAPLYINRALQDLERHEVLFGLCRTALLLPAYFAFKIHLVRTEQSAPPTRGSGKGKKKQRPAVAEGVRFKTVAALRIEGAVRPARRFTAPAYRIEVDGYWRLLQPQQTGSGPNGEREEGRTWVRGHYRWRERPLRPVEVLVKSRVAIARRIAATEEALKRATVSESSREPQEGVVEHAPRVSRDAAYRERLLLTTRLRWRILERDGFRCTKCGADAANDKGVRLDVDHITPVSVGGRTTPENLTTLCNHCNNGKGDSI